jgi:Holliday junction resolvase RusA-like endonuclease
MGCVARVWLAMMTRLVFKVAGHPEPAGSKRIVGPKRKGGGGWVGGGRVIDANPNAGPWKGIVSSRAAEAMIAAGYTLFDGPVGLAVIFTLVRPKGHFGSGRNVLRLKPSAPPFPIVKPDSTKLLRGVEDAMTGIVWRDDAQVVEQMVSKRYGEAEGAQVTVWTL